MPYVKQISIRQTLNRSLKYIVNDKKTEYGCLVSGMNCAANDHLAYKQMMMNKTHFGKENGLQGFHFVQSFKANEMKDPYRAHEVGLKWAKKMFGDQYQYIISTHMDKDHLHNHVIINSVSLRGKKFNACKESLTNARRLSDEVAREYNLDIIPENKHAVSKSYKEWNEEKNGASWKATIKADIDQTIPIANSFEDFMEKLQEKGYVLKQGHVKYMTFRHSAMERSVRGKTLGPEYTEERIRERIKLREFNLSPTKSIATSAGRMGKPLRKSFTPNRYYYKRASVSGNIILMIALLRTLMKADQKKIQNHKGRNYHYDLKIKNLTEQLKFISDKKLKSREELQQGKFDLEAKIREMNVVTKDAVKINDNLLLAVQSIETYQKYKSIHDDYEQATFRKWSIKRKHQTELETFQKARNQLEKMKVQPQQWDALTQKQKLHETQINKLQTKVKSIENELRQYVNIEKTLNDRSWSRPKSRNRNQNLDR